MFTFFAKYKRGILIALIAGISVPFIVAGGFSGLGGGGGGGGGNANLAAQGYNVAIVGNIPITQREMIDQIDAARQAGGQTRTYEQLYADGTVEGILDALIARNLVQIETQRQGLTFDREYLVERLKGYADFQTEDGQFDAQRWNTYVSLNEDTNWNALYDQVTQDLRMATYTQFMGASARVLEEDLREQFKDSHTKIQVRYAHIEPPISLTEEEIRAHYDANVSAYDLPESRIVRFTAISLQADPPPIIDEILEKARGGADFAELAREYSESFSKDDGGDMSWITESPVIPDYQQVIFDLKLGEISDPVPGPSSYFIYKLEEERYSEVTGERDVHPRQIMIRAALDPEERAARLARANQLAADAKAANDLGGPAAAAGLEILTTEAFSFDSVEIANVAAGDAFSFRRGVALLARDEISQVIQGGANLYVVQVTDVIPPEWQPFQTVQAKVGDDALAAYKRSPEFLLELGQYRQDIGAAIATLDDVPTLFPELGVEIQETREFAAAEYLFDDELFWNTQEVYELVGRDEPGEKIEIISDLTGKLYVIELLNRADPEESVWEEEWPGEKDRLYTAALLSLQNERTQDFLINLRERSVENNIPIQQDFNRILTLLGLAQDDTSAKETLTLDITDLDLESRLDSMESEAEVEDANDPTGSPSIAPADNPAGEEKAVGLP